MDIPAFITSFPALDVPFPEDVVTTHAIQSDKGLMVMFVFHQDVSLPEHSHKGQWGSVLEGRVTLTIAGKATTYLPGQSYFIEDGVPHAVDVVAGTKAIDIFEEADRYPLRS